MKKMLLVLGVAAAAMTSCTSDEVLEMNPTNTIKFESFVNRGTRAVTSVTSPDNTADGTYSGLKSFYVFGYYDTDNVVFDEVLVTKVENTTSNPSSIEWSYGTPIPWASEQTYQFAAYATANESTDLNASFAKVDDKPVLSFSNFAVTDESDLVIAYVNNHRAGSDVDLNFKHKLAKVKFTFTNNSNADDNLTMKVSDVTFSLVQTGDYNSSVKNEWTVKSGVAETELVFTENPNSTFVVQGNSCTTFEHLVLPQKLGSIKAAFTASYYDEYGGLVKKITYSDIVLGGEAVDDLDGEYWKPGYAYNYTAHLPVSPSHIKFNVISVDGWSEGSGDNGNATVDDTTGSITF